MAFYTGQNRKHIYKVEFYRNGVLVTPCVALYTTKKEAEKFVKQSNNASRQMNANRVAKYRKITLWRHSK